MEATEVIQAILAGHLDDDFADIVQALRQRQTAGAVELCWRITFEDLDITEENLTVGEAKIVEAALSSKDDKVSILTLPVAGSAKNIAAVVAAALVERRGVTTGEAFKTVGAVGVKALVKGVSEYTVTSPPKEPSDPATSES